MRVSDDSIDSMLSSVRSQRKYLNVRPNYALLAQPLPLVLLKKLKLDSCIMYSLQLLRLSAQSVCLTLPIWQLALTQFDSPKISSFKDVLHYMNHVICDSYSAGQ